MDVILYKMKKITATTTSTEYLLSFCGTLWSHPYLGCFEKKTIEVTTWIYLLFRSKSEMFSAQAPSPVLELQFRHVSHNSTYGSESQIPLMKTALIQCSSP